MSVPSWQEAPIGRAYNRTAFDCGEPALDEYLQRHARRNHERGGAKTFLAISDSDNAILGYYSLSPACVEYARVPELARRGVGRYEVSGFRLARLAVARAVQGQGLGGQLLLAAGRRCLRVSFEIGGAVILIDAKNERAARWYASFGAMPLADNPQSLVLPLRTVAETLRKAGKL